MGFGSVHAWVMGFSKSMCHKRLLKNGFEENNLCLLPTREQCIRTFPFLSSWQEVMRIIFSPTVHDIDILPIQHAPKLKIRQAKKIIAIIMQDFKQLHVYVDIHFDGHSWKCSFWGCEQRKSRVDYWPRYDTDVKLAIFFNIFLKALKTILFYLWVNFENVWPR